MISVATINTIILNVMIINTIGAICLIITDNIIIAIRSLASIRTITTNIIITNIMIIIITIFICDDILTRSVPAFKQVLLLEVIDTDTSIL